MLLLTAPAYSELTTWKEIADKTAKYLAPDAVGISKHLEQVKNSWNSAGLFSVYGFTDDNSNGLIGAGEARAHVETLGLVGSAVEYMAVQSDGTVEVGIAAPDVGDTATDNFATNGQNNPAYLESIAGYVFKFTPYYLNGLGAKVTVNGSSAHTGNDAVQIVGWTCNAYKDSSGAHDHSHTTEDDLIFKALNSIDDKGQTSAATYTLVDTSYAYLLDAPFNTCMGDN